MANIRFDWLKKCKQINNMHNVDHYKSKYSIAEVRFDWLSKHPGKNVNRTLDKVSAIPRREFIAFKKLVNTFKNAYYRL